VNSEWLGGEVLADTSVPEANDRVIVHQAHRLHERVANRGADELEPSAEQIATQCV
jgi:hypothetical protein